MSDAAGAIAVASGFDSVLTSSATLVAATNITVSAIDNVETPRLPQTIPPISHLTRSPGQHEKPQFVTSTPGLVARMGLQTRIDHGGARVAPVVAPTMSWTSSWRGAL